jgi:Protein of unknown function (DUF4446)
MQFIWFVIAVLFVWIAAITFLYWKLYTHYTTITKNVNGKSLFSVLEKLVRDGDSTKKDIAFLRETCDRIEKEGRLHIQKVGLLRFNPFKDTGGDQSFILSLVDGQNTGVVISGLYSRSGTRWYAKKVVEGKSIDHELSEEEKRALQEATSHKK